MLLLLRVRVQKKTGRKESTGAYKYFIVFCVAAAVVIKLLLCFLSPLLTAALHWPREAL